jgi:hypothetical protein
MRLIDNIIEFATSNGTPTSVVLRNCLVLAYKLNNQRLKTWVIKELEGYVEGDQVPEYRHIRITAKGTFFGPLGAQLNNQPLPSSILKKEHRNWANNALLFEPIAAYESVTDVKVNLIINWPPDLIAMYQSDFVKGYVLKDAWLEIPAPAVIALVDTVRNRVLSFTLEIREELGMAGDDIEAISSDKIEKTVINNIYGGNIVIAGTIDKSPVQQGSEQAVMSQSFQRED